jgi:hypothetical protein
MPSEAGGRGETALLVGALQAAPDEHAAAGRDCQRPAPRAFLRENRFAPFALRKHQGSLPPIKGGAPVLRNVTLPASAPPRVVPLRPLVPRVLKRRRGGQEARSAAAPRPPAVPEASGELAASSWSHMPGLRWRRQHPKTAQPDAEERGPRRLPSAPGNTPMRSARPSRRRRRNTARGHQEEPHVLAAQLGRGRVHLGDLR